VSSIRLAPTDVHVWQTSLDVPAGAADALMRSLSPEEQGRAHRLRRERDRLAYAVSRGTLRRLLAAYLGADGADIALVSGPHGKPTLAALEHSWLSFNVSHSADRAVFGFTPGAAIGVDVERVRADVRWDGVARRVLGAAELSVIEGHPVEMRPAAFFAAWTQLEAYLKGTGVGLAGRHQVAAERNRWTVAAVEAGDGYAAAVAVEGRDVDLPTVARRVPRLDG
jgi:4'-phosphopantetheinyl transferase